FVWAKPLNNQVRLLRERDTTAKVASSVFRELLPAAGPSINTAAIDEPYRLPTHVIEGGCAAGDPRQPSGGAGRAGLRPASERDARMNDSLVHPKRRGRDRVRLLVGGACAVVVVAASVALANVAHSEADRTITSNSTGTHNGFFFSYWKDSGNVTTTLGAAGQYSVQWSGINNTVVGKGWMPGSSHTVNYSGSFNC